ncbi:MAG: TonB family protein [Acidobacteriota bacterium]
MRARLLTTLLVMMVLPVEATLAQNIAGAISGIVKDDFGKTVAQATVTVKDEEQAIVAAAKTDTEGRYRIDNLPLGNYQLTVESEGLNSESVIDIKLTVASEVKLDLNMQLNLEGKAIKKIFPTYPALARTTRQEGRVIVGVIVNSEGKVEKTLFISGSEVFKSVALQAAQRWLFQKTNSGFSGRIAFNFKFMP